MLQASAGGLQPGQQAGVVSLPALANAAAKVLSSPATGRTSILKASKITNLGCIIVTGPGGLSRNCAKNEPVYCRCTRSHAAPGVRRLPGPCASGIRDKWGQSW